MKTKLAIIGYPLRHSISPAFQQAALDYYDLDIEYEAWETLPDQLAAAVGELRYPHNLGANVTIPYKEEVLNFLDELDEAADEIGAANTIVKKEDALVGYNTDATGFLRALKEDGAFDPAGKTAAIIGAGGAARAICYSLMISGLRSLTLINRSADRAADLADALRDRASARGIDISISQASWGGDEMKSSLAGSQLIVNCTPMGMKHGGQEKLSPLTAGQIPSGVLACDLVYNPSSTPFLKAAESAGARTLGGLPMLVYQGAAAFQLWTGKEAPVGAMFDAAQEALG